MLTSIAFTFSIKINEQHMGFTYNRDMIVIECEKCIIKEIYIWLLVLLSSSSYVNVNIIR